MSSALAGGVYGPEHDRARLSAGDQDDAERRERGTDLEVLVRDDWGERWVRLADLMAER